MKLALTLLCGLTLTAHAEPLLKMVPKQTLPAVTLRGYDKVGAQFWQLANGASLLQMDCESGTKAQLLHAKYLSDLGLLPGVKEKEIKILRNISDEK